MGSLFRGVQHFRLLLLATVIGVLSIGIVQLRGAPVDVLPEFTPPYAEIQTEALGLSADEVEQLITVPLEADLLNGVEGVSVIRSDSVPGLSSIVLVFTPGTDVYRARQLVEERLTQAHALPNVSRPPMLLQPLSSSSRVLMIALSSEKVSPIEQSVIARWTVRPRLMGVPGVANVAVWGNREQQLQVQVDPSHLRAMGVTLSQVISSAGNAQVVSPLSFLEASTPGTGGFIETPQQRLQVRHLLEKIADPAELGKVPVTGTAGRLRLSDVATIVVDHQPLIGDAVVAGGPGLMLVVEKFPGANARDVTAGVEKALEALRPGLSGIRTDTSLFRPASYLSDGLSNLALAGAAGFLLLLLVLVALRFQWRAVLITLVTLPLSLVVAGLVLRLFGQGFNAIVLGGLAAAVAVMVDESVVPTERAMRRLKYGLPRQRAEAGGPVPLSLVVREAAQEVRLPLLYATAIAVLAVVPVAVLSGRPGAFFAPLVLAYVVAVGAALLVAVTVTPVLTALLFPRWNPPGRQSLAGAVYLRALQRFSRGLRVPLLAAGACLLVGLAALPFLHTSLVPSFQDRNVLVRLEGEPGTSSPRMTEVATELSGRLQALSGVDNVGAHIGRAVTGDRVTNVSSSDVWVSIEPNADYEATMRAIRGVARDVDGAQAEVLTYLEQKMRDVGALNQGANAVRGNDLDLLTGSDQPVVVRLFGQDQQVLRQEADRVLQVVSSVEGVVDPHIDLPTTQPTIEIEVDLAKAQRLGVTPGDVRRAEATLLQGIQVGSVFQQQKVFDVIVQGAPSIRRDVADVRNLLLDRPGGGHVTLGQVADVRVVQTPAVIRRDAVSRRLDIEAGVSGRSVGSVVAEIERGLAGLTLPLEYHAEVLRQSTDREAGTGRAVGFALAVAVAAFLLLQAAFRSWSVAALVFVSIPLSLTGGLVAVLLAGGDLSLGSLLGFLALLGLATRTSMLLVADVQSHQRAGGEAPYAALVQTGARERFSPVLTTVGALAFFTLPFAVLGARPGLEVLHPMSLVLLGGLVTCTFVALFVLPALCGHLHPRAGHEDDRAATRIIDLDLDREAVVADRWALPDQAPVSAPDRDGIA